MRPNDGTRFCDCLNMHAYSRGFNRRDTAPHRWLLLLLWAGLLLPACKDKEAAGPGDAAQPPTIYADYRVWASEGDSMATCMLQFFTDAQKRQSLWLPAPTEVLVNDMELQGDSARNTGLYYEYQQPLASFGGLHRVLLRGMQGRNYRDSFYFPLFALASELPETIAKKDTEIRLSGLRDGSRLRVVLTDTAFSGTEYNEMLPVKDGAVVLPQQHLEQMHSGPIVIHLSAEEDRPLRSPLPGHLSVSYSLTRSFLLE